MKLFVDPTGRDGVEYPTPVGKIDILAIDEDESFYVFELKRGRGRDKVVGQVTRCMDWVSDTIGKNKKVIGVKVAKTIFLPLDQPFIEVNFGQYNFISEPTVGFNQDWNCEGQSNPLFQ